MAANQHQAPYPAIVPMQSESYPEAPPPYSQEYPSAPTSEQPKIDLAQMQQSNSQPQMLQQGYTQSQLPQQSYPQPQQSYSEPHMPQSHSQPHMPQSHSQPQMPQQGYSQPQQGYSQPQQGYSQPQIPQSHSQPQMPPLMYAPQQQMQQTTNVIVTNQPQSQTAYIQPIVLEQNWFIPAILSCLFCFWPTGIAAIIAANNAQNAAALGDINGAFYYTQRARNLTILSLVLGITWIIVVIATSV